MNDYKSSPILKVYVERAKKEITGEGAEADVERVKSIYQQIKRKATTYGIETKSSDVLSVAKLEEFALKLIRSRKPKVSTVSLRKRRAILKKPKPF